MGIMDLIIVVTMVKVERVEMEEKVEMVVPEEKAPTE